MNELQWRHKGACAPARAMMGMIIIALSLELMTKSMKPRTTRNGAPSLHIWCV